VELGEDAADLDIFIEFDLDIESVYHGWAKLYLLPEEVAKLEQLGFALSLLPDEGKIGLARMAEEGVARDVGKDVPALYHTYDTLTADLNTIATEHSDIARLTSAGLSVQGRELWVMQISDNPDIEEDEPEIHYISSMHGDEVVGKELCFNFINYLTDNYGTDPRVTNLVDSTDIRIMPSMNPDGTELGHRAGTAIQRQRLRSEPQLPRPVRRPGQHYRWEAAGNGRGDELGARPQTNPVAQLSLRDSCR
jgi:hypothetical protein